MEGAVAAGAKCVEGASAAALATKVAQPECERLCRYCLKVGLLLSELRLVMSSDEALRGSKTVFLAVDATVNALRQAEELLTQCAGTKPSSIWPLEDAVEFQAVAAELQSAAAGLAALGGRLPADVQQDAAHVYRQLMGLSFTEGELSETEELELERVQHYNSAVSPRHPAAAAGADAALPPPAAPAEQYAEPEAALASAAVASSERAAAAARAVSPSPPSQADEAQRAALQAAAAVAVTAAADVLNPAEGLEGEEEGGGERAAGEEEAPSEGAGVLQQEMREEVEEAAAAAAGARGVVLTSEGELALSPTAHSNGADPFEMTDTLAPGTLSELKSFRHVQEDIAQADEAQLAEAERTLQPAHDYSRLGEQVAGAAGQGGAAAAGGADTGAQALAALQQLQDYESAMAAGEEAEEAAAAEEGAEEGGSVAAAAAGGGEGVSVGPVAPPPAGSEPPEPLHKSRSEQAAAALAQNLDELAHAGSAPVLTDLLHTASKQQLEQLIVQLNSEVGGELEGRIVALLPPPDLEAIRASIQALEKKVDKAFPHAKWGSNRDNYAYKRVGPPLRDLKAALLEHGKTFLDCKRYDALLQEVPSRFQNCF